MDTKNAWNYFFEHGNIFEDYTYKYAIYVRKNILNCYIIEKCFVCLHLSDGKG